MCALKREYSVYEGIPVQLAMPPQLSHGFDVENSSEQPIRQINICWQALIQTVRRNYFIFGIQSFPLN